MEIKDNLVDESVVVSALAALAQTHRLRAFRALVVAGPAGLSAGAIAAQLEIGPSSLSFHLKELVHAGLITSEQRGRQLIYRAGFERMSRLLAYLTLHCCQGDACEVSQDCPQCEGTP